MLKIHIKNKALEPVLIIDKLYSIGSADTNNLVLKDAGVDAVHARLISTNNKTFIKDNDSAAGCFVNEQRVTHKELMAGDIVRIGSVELEILDPYALPTASEQQNPSDCWRLVADGNWLSGQSFPISSHQPCIIGRGEDCGIMIPGTHLSRHHAEITTEGSILRIKDLGSVNGTYINDVSIEEVVLRDGDRLRLDVYTFRVVSPENDLDKTRVRMPLSNIVKPIEVKKVSDAPKRWKTRPTSPGNRDEPTYDEDSRGKGLWMWLAFGGLALALLLGAIFH